MYPLLLKRIVAVQGTTPGDGLVTAVMHISRFIFKPHPRVNIPNRELGSRVLTGSLCSFSQCAPSNKSSLYAFYSLTWFFEIYFQSRGVRFVFMSTTSMSAAQELEGTRSSRIGFRGGCEPSCLLGAKPGFSSNTANVLTSDPSLQHFFPFLIWLFHLWFVAESCFLGTSSNL